MYKISIIEDSGPDLSVLKDCLEKYADEKGLDIYIETFGDVELFLTKYKADSDIVFMDIELPGMDGMRGAGKLREIDPKVVLIFVTNMVQFAVKGYEVEALDYVVKPVKYGLMKVKLDKAFRMIDRRDEDYISIVYDRCFRKVNLRDLLYIEVRSHRLYYHLMDGSVVDVRGTLDDMEEKLRSKNFIRTNSCYLVNMRYISDIHSDSIVVGKEELQISRRKRSELVEKYSGYIAAKGEWNSHSA